MQTNSRTSPMATVPELSIAIGTNSAPSSATAALLAVGWRNSDDPPAVLKQGLNDGARKLAIFHALVGGDDECCGEAAVTPDVTLYPHMAGVMADSLECCNFCRIERLSKLRG